MALIKLNTRSLSDDSVTTPKIDDSVNLGRRNYIVNGGFQIWQRGTTLSSVVNRWGPDRFFNTNTSMTWTRAANTFDAPTPYMCVLTGGGSDSRFRFSFELPSSTVQKPFEIGSYWTLSMYTDLDISGRTMNITYANNPNDTPVNASPNATWVSLGSNRYSLTVQINAENTSNKVGMRFSGPFTGPVAEGVNSISVTGVQFERGQEATPFEERSYGEELALCQRYFQIWGSSGSTGTNGDIFPGFYRNSSQVFVPVTLPVTMRTTPSFSAISNSGAQFSSQTQDTPITSFALSNTPTPRTVFVVGNSSSAFATGNGIVYTNNGSTADAFSFSAEV